ncbi:MAG TPA: copper amine oxidase N-terminal domain-containing protein [Tissierellaceae bacterium]|nr:copper amine oxidase N-terminal domain-containing protein [Tissierellaceae bacterium]
MKKTILKTLKGFVLGVIVTTVFMSTVIGAGVKTTIDVVFDSVKIFVNGEKQEIDNLIFNDTTYVPLRKISEAYDKKVIWDGANRTVNIYNKDISQGETYDRISEYMKAESIAAYSPYYELLDFQISNYKEVEADGKIEATFFYKIIEKNFDRDPDTVEYIKELKESGHKHYQQLYDEYLEPRGSNYDLKVVIDKDDNITLYSNESPKGVEWVETKMTDFILKD